MCRRWLEPTTFLSDTVLNTLLPANSLCCQIYRVVSTRGRRREGNGHCSTGLILCGFVSASWLLAVETAPQIKSETLISPSSSCELLDSSYVCVLVPVFAELLMLTPSRDTLAVPLVLSSLALHFFAKVGDNSSWALLVQPSSALHGCHLP
jgi:hypothetical protein